jgi:Tfp pilus assembly protein PilO
MANLLNKSRFFLFLTSFSKVHRLGLTLFSLFSVFIVWLFFFYFPLERLIQQQKASQNDLENLQKTYEQNLKDLDFIRRENEQLSAKFKELISIQNESKNRLDFVMATLKKNNLYCLKFNPYEHKQNEVCCKDYYLFKAKGKFVDIISFFNELEKSDCIIKFKDAKFERRGKSNILFETKIRVVKFLKSV